MRERTLMSNIEMAYLKALREASIDMNVDVLTSTAATTLVATIVRLLGAQAKRTRRKWRKQKVVRS